MSRLEIYTFPDGHRILDFLHLAAHLYGAAQAAFGKERKEAWEFYKKLVRRAWSGEVGSLIKMCWRHRAKGLVTPRRKPPKMILERLSLRRWIMC